VVSLSKYRRRFDIIADVLNAAGKGGKKTKIMYFANLSYLLLQKYLSETIHVGFLRFNNDGYEVTEKGLIFLEKYQEFSSKYLKAQKKFEALKFEMEALERMCSPEEARRGKLKNGRRKRLAVLS
jgi:predicted transcriptional regulator